MSAEDLWRARPADDSKKTVIRNLWPELAAALEGRAPAAPQGADKPRVPVCEGCEQRRARGTAGGVPVCIVCVGREPYARARPVIMIPAWGPNA